MPKYEFVNRGESVAMTVECAMRDIEYITEKLLPVFLRKYTPPAIESIPGFSEAMEESVAELATEERQAKVDGAEALADLSRELKAAGIGQ